MLSLERPQIEKPEGDIPFDLGIEDLIVGDGDEATKGKKVSVHYVGVAFSTGEEFDASWNRGQPFEFKLGKGQVIPGWDAGVQGMKVGGRRKLTIPSAMAYGARGARRRDQAARAAGVRGRSAVRGLGPRQRPEERLERFEVPLVQLQRMDRRRRASRERSPTRRRSTRPPSRWRAPGRRPRRLRAVKRAGLPQPTYTAPTPIVTEQRVARLTPS